MSLVISNSLYLWKYFFIQKKQTMPFMVNMNHLCDFYWHIIQIAMNYCCTICRTIWVLPTTPSVNIWVYGNSTTDTFTMIVKWQFCLVTLNFCLYQCTIRVQCNSFFDWAMHDLRFNFTKKFLFFWEIALFCEIS